MDQDVLSRFDAASTALVASQQAHYQTVLINQKPPPDLPRTLFSGRTDWLVACLTNQLTITFEPATSRSNLIVFEPCKWTVVPQEPDRSSPAVSRFSYLSRNSDSSIRISVVSVPPGSAIVSFCGRWALSCRDHRSVKSATSQITGLWTSLVLSGLGACTRTTRATRIVGQPLVSALCSVVQTARMNFRFQPRLATPSSAEWWPAARVGQLTLPRNFG